MAQTPFYPTWIFFFFVSRLRKLVALPQSATQDNPGKHSRKIARALLETVRFTDCATPTPCPVKTIRHLGSVVVGAALLVLRKRRGENRLQDLGYTYEWLQDECLRVTTPVLPAVLETNGQKTFFNQLIAAFHGWKDSRNDPTKSITFGNGTPIDPVHIENLKTSRKIHL